MNELIKIIEKDGKNAVSARELYKFLSGEENLMSNVTAWMQRNIEKNDFLTINVDYQIIRYLNESNRSMIDYAITLDTAKELCMLSQCEKGKQARLYFIECEKQLLKPKELSRKELALMIIESETARELAEAKIKEQEPKVEVYEKIVNADNLLTLNDAAKAIGIGRNTMTEKLRDKKILIDKGTKPYQRFINEGYFIVKINPIKKGEEIENYNQTYVTGKGLIYLAKILN